MSRAGFSSVSWTACQSTKMAASRQTVTSHTKSKQVLAQVLSFGVVALCLSQTGCGGVSQASSSVAFDSTEIDLGSIRLESEYNAQFDLRNRGPFPVRIREVRTSCGCVAADFERSVIDPGESRRIELKLSTRGLSILGPLLKYAWVRFDNEERADLTVHAHVEPDYEVTPRRLEFSGDSPVQVIRLTRRHMDENASDPP